MCARVAVQCHVANETAGYIQKSPFFLQSTESEIRITRYNLLYVQYLYSSCMHICAHKYYYKISLTSRPSIITCLYINNRYLFTNMIHISYIPLSVVLIHSANYFHSAPITI